MKFKFIATAVAMTGCILGANAQEKLGNDYFIGLNGGVISVTTDHMNTPSIYGNLEFGKYLAPTYGTRIVIGGGQQNYSGTKGAWQAQGQSEWTKKQAFAEINLDGFYNISQALSSKSLALVDFYVFAGPTMNLASKCTVFSGDRTADGTLVVKDAEGLKARLGATAGLGLGFNLSKYFNLGVEYRAGVTPSIFGDASVCRKAEETNRLTLRLAYTFNGRLGKDGWAAKNKVVETVTNTVEVPVEKIVTKEVVKEVEKIVEVANPVANYVFFDLGKATLKQEDKVRLDQVAAAIKGGDKSLVYTVAGHADKGTGSAKTNQALSEKRAQVVYDYLVSQGVPASQLKIEANGGVDNMFFDTARLSRVTIIAK